MTLESYFTSVVAFQHGHWSWPLPKHICKAVILKLILCRYLYGHFPYSVLPKLALSLWNIFCSSLRLSIFSVLGHHEPSISLCKTSLSLSTLAYNFHFVKLKYFLFLTSYLLVKLIYLPVLLPEAFTLWHFSIFTHVFGPVFRSSAVSSFPMPDHCSTFHVTTRTNRTYSGPKASPKRSGHLSIKSHGLVKVDNS